MTHKTEYDSLPIPPKRTLPAVVYLKTKKPKTMTKAEILKLFNIVVKG